MLSQSPCPHLPPAADAGENCGVAWPLLGNRRPAVMVFLQTDVLSKIWTGCPLFGVVKFSHIPSSKLRQFEAFEKVEMLVWTHL